MTRYTIDFNNCKTSEDILPAIASGFGESGELSDWGDMWYALRDGAQSKAIKLRGLESIADTMCEQMDIMLRIFSCYMDHDADSVVEVEIGEASYPINGYFKA